MLFLCLPFLLQTPNFFPFAALCLPSLSLGLLSEQLALAELLASTQQSDTAPCATPVDWGMKNIAGYVMCEAKSHRSHLVSYSLLQKTTGESWFVWHQGDSKVARLIIFLFSLSVHNLNIHRTNLLCS